MLDLNEFMPEDEVIKFNEDKFIVTADVPIKLIGELAKIENTEDQSNEEKLKMSMNWIKSLLYLKNDKEKVNVFLDSLNIKQLKKISEFISEYINANMIDEKKKKN